jgi:hypothetical protein
MVYYHANEYPPLNQAMSQLNPDHSLNTTVFIRNDQQYAQLASLPQNKDAQRLE